MTSTMELVRDYVSETHNINSDAVEARAALEQRIKELEANDRRYRWLRDEAKSNVLIDIATAYPRTDAAVDRAMSEAALDKMRQISEEYKLP